MVLINLLYWFTLLEHFHYFLCGPILTYTVGYRIYLITLECGKQAIFAVHESAGNRNQWVCFYWDWIHVSRWWGGRHLLIKIPVSYWVFLSLFFITFFVTLFRTDFCSHYIWITVLHQCYFSRWTLGDIIWIYMYIFGV